MESKKRRQLYFVLTMIAVAALIICGTILAFRSFNRFSRQVLSDQDERLMDVAEAVDHSIANCFDRYCEDMEYVTGRRGFLEAEELWRQTGDTEDLLYRLGENLLAQNQRIADMTAVVDGQVICSTSGKTDYTFPASETPIGKSDVLICVDSENIPYLVFLQDKEDISYAAMMELTSFYELIEKGANTDGGMTLLSYDGNVFLQQAENGPEVRWTADLTGQENVDILLNAWKSGASQTSFYETESYTARIAVLAHTSSINCRFTVGVINNYDETTQPVRSTVIELTIFGAMVVSGIALLLSFALSARKHNERNAEELVILREKKDAMEALNREAQEFAHHQRLEIIGQLTSSIAHEFNNLLTPIMGYSIMVMENLPPEDEESYDNTLEIYNASRKAKEIISRLSDLSRKNTGLTFQYVAPDDLVERVLGVAAPAKPKNVTVETELGCHHLWLYGNETQFTQLLLNLIINAFQAMEQDGGVLTIATEADEANIRFRIKDTGPGIPEAIRKIIFDPFFTTKEGGKGTGLGLAIVQQVVEEHQGGITLNTHPDQGTEFVISFPICPREETK